MPVSVLAKLAGVPTATINFYVQQGLLPPPEKLSRTRALYTEEHLEWLQIIWRFQELGYPLQLIKRGFELVGKDAQGLEKIKRAGILQPIPPTRSEESAPLGPVTGGAPPMNTNEFVKASELSEEQVRKLEALGVLRPRVQSRYDATDLELVEMVKRILSQEIPLEALDFYQDFIPIAQRLAHIGMELARSNREALRRREVRLHDLGDPFSRIMDYLMFRMLFELYPAFHEEIYGTPEESGGPGPQETPLDPEEA